MAIIIFLQVIEHQDTFKNKGFIITNSNCSISGLAIALYALKKSNILYNVFVSTYQTLSGAGFEGLQSIP
jgi:aspartate-semialdehyde dehydrogenase